MARGIQRENQRRYLRRGPIREPYPVVLIVCEGKKTEPAYFDRLRAEFRLSSANVKAVPSDYGNDPISIVRYGEDQLNSSEGYDRVYCVFDRNGHTNFDEACQRVANSEAGRAKRLQVIRSIPCFEFWILLHFNYTSAPFRAAGGRSSCARVIERLKAEYLKDYEKNFEGMFDLLKTRLEAAIRNGERLERENARNGTLNPATDVHLLVKNLRDLRD